MRNSDTKAKVLASIITLCFTVLCTIVSYVSPIETTTMKIVGSFISVPLISIAAWKFPKYFYIIVLLFDVLATSIGSVINLYKYVGCYDKLVHYLSGILLTEAGIIIISYTFKKRNLKIDHFVKQMFAFFFSVSCAGFWEIYEFTADSILKTNMQGRNENTMGDIVAGVLGALTYIFISFLINKRKTRLHSKREF